MKRLRRIGFLMLAGLSMASFTASAQDRRAPADQQQPQQQQPPQPPPIQARPGSRPDIPRSTYEHAVAKGSRLVLTNNAGEVIIRGWDRDDLKVEASHSSREKLDVSQANESTIRVRTVSTRGRPGLVDYRISVPRWMPINLSGTYLDADIEGTSAEVTVETVGGNIRLSGGSGAVSLRSVEGSITVEKATGRVQASAVNEGITLTNTQGEVLAEAINGDIVIENAQTSNLEVSTVNGDVTFNGTVRDSGVYRLATHGGDIRVGLGGAANAIVFVRTFKGDFSSDFPIQLPEGQRGEGSKRFNFTLGSGSARIQVESFSGDIHLARTKVTAPREERRRRRMGVAYPTDLPDMKEIERMTRHAMDTAAEALDSIDVEALTDEMRRSVEEALRTFGDRRK